MRKLAIFVLLSAASSFAQFTTVTGTVIDPHGVPYALGTIVPTLITSASPTLNGGPYTPPSQAVGLDINGKFSFNVADTSILKPTGSKWNFTVCSAVGTVNPAIGTGSQCFSLAAPIAITGSTQNISTQLNAVALALTVPINGGGVCPGGSTNQVQYNSAGNCAGIANVAAGSELVSKGSSSVPAMQTKPYYDVRDFGCAQDGVTDDTACVTSILNTIGSNQATILFTGPTALESVTFPTNVTLQFQQAGALQPITSTTPIGGSGFVQGNGTSNVNTLTSSCSVTLTGTAAGDSAIIMENHFFTAANIPFGAVTDNQGGHYTQLAQQGFNFSSVNSAWVRSNLPGGNVTITVPYTNNLGAPVNVANGCIAWEISGDGPVVASESNVTCTENAGSPSTTMSCAAISTTAGSLVIGFGGQSYLNQASCTPGAGFTQPAGTAGFISGGSQPSTGYGFNLCATYKLVSPGGNQTPSQTITADPLNVPLNKYWSYAAASIVPSSAVINIQGPIWAPAVPIFLNAFAGQGTIDLSGNTAVDKVFPEWWGASGNAGNATTNTQAIQAAIIGAYGANRVNGSGANQFNRELHFSGLYQINGSLSLNHVNGFKITGCQEFACGFNQTATNTSIFTTTTGGTYGHFDDLVFESSVSEDLNHPLVDLNYTGVPSPDLVTQFIEFNDVNFHGNQVVKTGSRFAAAGGGAQASNMMFHAVKWNGFTEAGLMLGSGSGCVAAQLATNAVSISIDAASDLQGNNAYGIENFGGGTITVDTVSFEDGFGAQTNEGIQTGYDICGQVGAAGEWVDVRNMRSESLYTLGGVGPYVVHNSFNVDQAFALAPGATPQAQETIQGSGVAGHGIYYTTTAGGHTWLGIGTQTSPIIASSGTATTLVNTNQSVTGTNTIGQFTKLETVSQAVTGSTGVLLNVPISIGVITGSVTSGTIGFNDIVTQATTGVTCTTTGTPPTGSANLSVEFCSGAPDNSHIYTDGTTGGTYTPTSTPTFGAASPIMVITAATGSPDSSHNWTGLTSSAVLVPSGAPTNTANYTPNAWIGWYLTLTYQQNITGGAAQYCIITANGTQSFTCAGGWITDFTAITIANPDDTSAYLVEPQWGVQTSNNGNTWSPISKKITGLAVVDGFFAPGLQISVQNTPRLHGLQVTRADWMANTDPDNLIVFGGVDGVLAGVPSGNVSGGGAGTLGQAQLIRPWKFPRNTLTEIPYANQNLLGTTVQHWSMGQNGGGTAIGDVYQGIEGSLGNHQGRWFLTQNSSNVAAYTAYFNADGSFNFPYLVSGTDWNGTVGATSAKAGTFTTATSATYATATDCAVNSASPAACGSAASGAVVIPTTTTTYTVNTTAVTAHSRIQITWLTFASDLPSAPTCVAPAAGAWSISNVVPGTSFTIALPSTTGQTCPQFDIKN
jgi:hypothetical protein